MIRHLLHQDMLKAIPELARAGLLLMAAWSMNSACLPSRTARWAVSIVRLARVLRCSWETAISILLQSYRCDNRQIEGPRM